MDNGKEDGDYYITIGFEGLGASTLRCNHKLAHSQGIPGSRGLFIRSIPPIVIAP